jgi:N-acetylmuramoyl-L-alanine amidase
LAKNIYFEARGEPLAGKLAVAQVTLNRVRSTRYHNSICEVVYAKHQFSWTKTFNRTHIRNPQAWEQSLALAQKALSRGFAKANFHATLFHNHKVKPKWAAKSKKIATIGNHTFYM